MKKIAQLRKKADMTQAELGAALNVSPQAVSKWENGLAEPDLATLKRIAEKFNITVDELISDDEGEQEKLGDEEYSDSEPYGVDSSCEDGSDSRNGCTQTAGQAVALAEDSEKFYGCCKECGIAVYESNLGEPQPLICKGCADAAKKAKEESDRAYNYDLRIKRRKCIIFGILSALAFALVGFLVIKYNKFDSRLYFALPVISYFGFAFAAELSMGRSTVAAVLMWCLTRTVKFPGIIFTWDLDGFAFLIAMKVLFAVLGFVIGFAFAVIGVVSSSVLSAFFLPHDMKKLNTAIKYGFRLYGDFD